MESDCGHGSRTRKAATRGGFLEQYFHRSLELLAGLDNATVQETTAATLPSRLVTLLAQSDGFEVKRLHVTSYSHTDAIKE